MPRARSLRTKLLAGLLLPIALFVGVDTVSLYHSALAAAHSAYDRQLVAAAHSIGDMLRLERGRLQLTVPYAVLELNQPRGAAMFFRVNGFDGELLWGDSQLPSYSSLVTHQAPYAGLAGVVHTTVRGEPVRMAALYQPVDGSDRSGLVLIQVAEPLANREQLARGILARTLALQALLIAAVVGVTLVVVSRALAPLRSLRDELDRREASNLLPMRTDAGVPTELRPVIEALNQLMQRVRNLMGQQQRFVADAAHQLRTPLAVLNTQLQSGLSGDVPPATLLQEMQGTVKRATELSNHMLSLAKVEQLRDRAEGQVCDLYEVAHDAAIDLSPLVVDKDLDFELFVAPATPTAVLAHPWLMGELVRNLLHNAVRHTPNDESLGISLSSDSGCVILQCWDSGPGIPRELRERVFEPFATVHAPGMAGGSGLGLSICHAIVTSLHGHIELSDHRPGEAVPGLRVTVRLPKAPRPQGNGFGTTRP